MDFVDLYILFGLVSKTYVNGILNIGSLVKRTSSPKNKPWHFARFKTHRPAPTISSPRSVGSGFALLRADGEMLSWGYGADCRLSRVRREVFCSACLPVLYTFCHASLMTQVMTLTS